MRILNKSLHILNCIVPKKNIVIFNSYPPFSDNAKALYKYIISERKDIKESYELWWAQEKNSKIPDFVDYKRVVVKKSLKGIWIYLRAKYIISTHGYFLGSESGNRQVQYNLWHGSGYKDIKREELVYRGDITIATSELYKEIQSRVLSIKKDRVFITGLPRNDSLFADVNGLNKLGILKEKYSRIAIWLPTYRKASVGHVGVDGDDSYWGPGSISIDEYERLNIHLKSLNELLIIKLHPMDSVNLDHIYNLSNIYLLTNGAMNQAGIDLYEILQNTDVLLSDYSSVIADYLLLDKPIVMIVSDIEEYRNSRGFVFDNVEEYMPGPIVTNLNELIEYFIKSETIDYQWKPVRERIKVKFHKYIDSKSCSRVGELIFGSRAGSIDEL